MSDAEIQELNGSELGTKDYWDQSYDIEIENYKSHGDVGEVWFDEDSQIRVINWMLRNDIPTDSEIIDLGNNFRPRPMQSTNFNSLIKIIVLSFI